MSGALQPLVFAVVTNYNNRTDTEETVRSMRASSYPNLSICVLDNGSTDGSADYLAGRLDRDVILLRNRVNEGVSRAYNRGIREALRRGADYILIANNDIEIESDCIGKLVSRAEEPGGPDLCAPVMYYFWDRTKIWFTGGGVDFVAGQADHCSSLEEFRCLPQERRFITACAMLIRSSMIQRAGYYDERFFMYYDDTDFSLRVARGGGTMDVVEGATLYHKVGASSESTASGSPVKVYHLVRSGLLFWRKHLGWWMFHRRYCEGHLGKVVNTLDVEWREPGTHDHAQMIIDALWYFVSGRRNALERPSAPAWFRGFVLRRPWLFAELMAFRFGGLLRGWVGGRGRCSLS